MDDAEAAVLTERETEYAESMVELRRRVGALEERFLQVDVIEGRVKEAEWRIRKLENRRESLPNPKERSRRIDRQV